MGILVVQSSGASVHLAGGRLRVVRPDQPSVSVPLESVDAVMVLGGASATTPALRALTAGGGRAVFCDAQGRLRFIACGPSPHDPDLLAAQVRASPELTLGQAVAIVQARLAGQRALISQHVHHHGACAATDEALHQIALADAAAPRAADVAALRGHEGAAARAYWAAFATLRHGDLPFDGRSTRPPLDAMNALLSFGAALLIAELTAHTIAAGLSPSFGTLHVAERGRPSLACDLAEPFRAPLVESLALRLCNLRILRCEDFVQVSGGTRLADRARDRFLEERQSLLARRTADSRTGEHTTWRRLLALEAGRYATAWRDGLAWVPARWSP